MDALGRGVDTSESPARPTTKEPRSCTTSQVPDAAGRFGAFGGRYVPETLTRASMS